MTNLISLRLFLRLQRISDYKDVDLNINPTMSSQIDNLSM